MHHVELDRRGRVLSAAGTTRRVLAVIHLFLYSNIIINQSASTTGDVKEKRETPAH